MKIVLVTLFVFAIIMVVIPDFAIAQTPPPLIPFAPDQAPIDGGVTLLAAAGGAYAWKKLRHKVK